MSQRSWVRYPVWQHTFVSPSAFSRRAAVSYWRKYVHKVLVNRLGGLSLPRKNVVRLTDRPDMTLDVYRGRKTTMQQQQQLDFMDDPANTNFGGSSKMGNDLTIRWSSHFPSYRCHQHHLWTQICRERCPWFHRIGSTPRSAT